MITDLPLYLSALIIGLLGSSHCIGMCGGITSALSLSISQRSTPAVFGLMLCYHLGRITSYGLAGFILGSLGWFLGDSSTTLQLLLRILAGVLLIAMGLYISGIWRGLSKLEALGNILWRRIQPIANRLLPIKNATSAFTLGSLWGWLPCGLVYSTLIWASSQGSAVQSSLLMACFGLGTLPAVMLTGLLSRQLMAIMQKKMTRWLVGGLMILFGIWTLPGKHQLFLNHFF